MRERRPQIAVVGAGVSGLTCGVVLAESGFDVTVFAREIYKTTSSVAAAIWYPYHVEPRAKVEKWDTAHTASWWAWQAIGEAAFRWSSFRCRPRRNVAGCPRGREG